MSKADQKSAMKDSLARLEKKFGAGIAVQMGAKKIQPVKVFHSGSITLDLAIGDGGVNCGIPWGRILEISGPEGSGKTTLAMMIVAQVQKQKKLAAYIDAEHVVDPIYAEKLGVSVKDLVISQPDYGEQALEVADEFVSAGAVSVVVVDSVAALVPKAELEGEMGDSHPGLQARMMSQAMRKLSGKVARQDVCIVFINQIREKIGVMWGNPETTTGGRALKFYASLRMDIRRTATLKDGEKILGNRTKVKINKNKIAKPFKECEFDLIFGEGISRVGEIVDLGVKFGIIEKSGAWYECAGERLGQGREAAKRFLKENRERADGIVEAIYVQAAKQEG